MTVHASPLSIQARAVPPIVATHFDPALAGSAQRLESNTPRLAVTVVRGDGIGPEIMDACLSILDAAGARLDAEIVPMGASLAAQGGIGPEAWDSIARTSLLYKAPLTTPQGKGAKSLNVTLRKTLGLYANIRPCVAYAPHIASAHSGMDVVIVRENEEDLYAGIEHRQTADVVQCLKIITRSGCERIARAAFDYARANKRRLVTCVTKDNIMKMTDGLFRSVFEEIAAEYPEIKTDHRIVDIAAARLATRPETFDVVLAPNLYGDILSDIAAEVAGSVGLAPSANLGVSAAMFEAVHGSAPDIAGQDVANPSGLLLAGAMMMEHAGRAGVAARVRAAWASTIEDGLHTADMAGPQSRAVLGTRAFADAVIARLEEEPAGESLHVAPPASVNTLRPTPAAAKPAPVKEMVGVDVFLDWRGTNPDSLAEALRFVDGQGLTLQLITSRGVKVWPGGHPATRVVDHWRCRFLADSGHCNGRQAARLMDCLVGHGFDVVKTEGLYTFDGAPGFSVGQGQ